MGFRPYPISLRSPLERPHSAFGTDRQCRITFRYGAPLVVSTFSASGLPPGTARALCRFLAISHRRLIDAGQASRISFTLGTTPGRAMVLNVSLALGGLLFGALPLVLALSVRSWEPLEIMLIGLLFLWPIWEAAQKNQPGTYTPRSPPDLLA